MSAVSTRPTQVVRYNRTAMTLHWVVASLILINVCVGLAAVNAPKGHDRPLVDMHKSIGITLFGLILMRFLWRLAHRPPPLPGGYPRRERILAHAVHASLYAVMLALPLSGYIHDSAFKDAAVYPLRFFGTVQIPRIGLIASLDQTAKEAVHSVFGAVHVYLGYALYALVALHLLGVAKHHAVDHEEELQRMLPQTYRRPDPAE